MGGRAWGPHITSLRLPPPPWKEQLKSSDSKQEMLCLRGMTTNKTGQDRRGASSPLKEKGGGRGRSLRWTQCEAWGTGAAAEAGREASLPQLPQSQKTTDSEARPSSPGNKEQALRPPPQQHKQGRGDVRAACFLTPEAKEASTKAKH